MTKFVMLMKFDPLDRFDRQKFEISKIQDDGSRHFEKSPYLEYINTSQVVRVALQQYE